MEHTGIYAKEQELWGAGEWWHFGNDDWYGNLLRKHKPFAHIPIRHPHDVARSWASRPKTGDAISNMVNCYEDMFDYLEKHDAQLYRVEDLPRLAGTGEHKEGDHSARITEFINAVDEKVIEPHRDFFAKYYEDLCLSTPIQT